MKPRISQSAFRIFRAPRSALRVFLLRLAADDRGAVMVEYVLLLAGVFVSVNVTISPLKAAMLEFAKDVIRALQKP